MVGLPLSQWHQKAHMCHVNVDMGPWDFTTIAILIRTLNSIGNKLFAPPPAIYFKCGPLPCHKFNNWFPVVVFLLVFFGRVSIIYWPQVIHIEYRPSLSNMILRVYLHNIYNIYRLSQMPRWFMYYCMDSLPPIWWSWFWQTMPLSNTTVGMIGSTPSVINNIIKWSG